MGRIISAFLPSFRISARYSFPLGFHVEEPGSEPRMRPPSESTRLCFLLVEEPDELLEDRIRIAMDIKPVIEEGKKMPISAAYRELKHYSLEKYKPYL